MPPGLIQMPSAALHILKKIGNSNGFNVQIKYWNIEFEKMFLDWKEILGEDYYELSQLAPFVFDLSKQLNDENAQKAIHEMLAGCWSEKNQKGRKRCGKNLAGLPEKTTRLINKCIDREFQSPNYGETIISGFSQKLYQWLPATTIAQRTKKVHPDIKTVIGGFSSKSSAIELMKVFSCFDFAVWGEAEFAFLELCESLCNNSSDFHDIPGLIYRDGIRVHESKNKSRIYFDLDNYPEPDYKDFFSESNEDVEKGFFHFYPIEMSRGCFWNRCKFCVLGSGYKYRERCVKSVIKEIKYAVKNYDVGYFQFLDNNIIGESQPRMEELIQELINLTICSEKDFCFFAELTPYNLNADYYKKLALAGFRMIQIGGESLSESLLKKMNKRNTFSDNILAYKFCIKYGIRIEGANIISGIPGETKKDIRECLANIHFLRFFLSKKNLILTESVFALEKLSKFFKEIPDDDLKNYNDNFLYCILPKVYKDAILPFEFFSFRRNKPYHNLLWKDFFNKIQLYQDADFSYKIFFCQGSVIYEEFNNKVKQVSLVFNCSEQWEILVYANRQLRSFSEMYHHLSSHFKSMNPVKLKKMMKELKKRHLIYFNENFDNIVSVVDTDSIL